MLNLTGLVPSEEAKNQIFKSIQKPDEKSHPIELILLIIPSAIKPSENKLHEKISTSQISKHLQ